MTFAPDKNVLDSLKFSYLKFQRPNWVDIKLFYSSKMVEHNKLECLPLESLFGDESKATSLPTKRGIVRCSTLVGYPYF